MSEATEDDDRAAAHAVLIRRLRGNGIENESVLGAMRDMPRHRFIPKELVNEAYADAPLPIGEGQTISQPWVVARMTEYVMACGPRKVLEVGTGSGYQAAVLSRLVEQVFTVERIERLAINARSVWDTLGLDNIVSAHADGCLGWAAHAPFDAIVVTAGARRVPVSLYAQLGEGGRLVMPVGDFTQRLLVSDMKGGKHTDVDHEGVRFVPLLEGVQ